jgi:hypothetical protein
MNVHLVRNEILPPAEKDFTETGFLSPEHLGENVFGWEVVIQSKLNNTERSQVLFIETSSEYQFSADSNFADEFNSGVYMDTVVELVHAAHCHHAAVFNHCAKELPSFSGLMPRFVTRKEVEEATLEAMKNAGPI